MCGLVALASPESTLPRLQQGLVALQHRGQESAGLAWVEGETIQAIRQQGLARELPQPSTASSLGIGHVRYSTTGHSLLTEAQPLCWHGAGGPFALAHNGNLTNADALRALFPKQLLQTDSDTELIVHLLAREPEKPLQERLWGLYKVLEGAFSLVVLSRDSLFALRDPQGYRPLYLAQDGSTVAVASEPCGLSAMRVSLQREIAPGEVFSYQKGMTSSRQVTTSHTKSCVFELVYFSRPDQQIFGIDLRRARQTMGRILAQEAPCEADIVVGVPESGMLAAEGYAVQSGLPLVAAVQRQEEAARSFILPKPSQRMALVEKKFRVDPNAVHGRRVVLVDDSLVRGTTASVIVQRLRAVGAREVHLRLASPAIQSPCHYGIDTPSQRELLAARCSPEEAAAMLQLDSIQWLSRRGLAAATKEHGLCDTCMSRETDFSLEIGVLSRKE